ncbi:SecY subunit of pre protein translocase [Mycotypha africana]|uniref:SecY subunit of pre protein translocase n=1 Tax=Mycotypha africana TaxID=64632 RepID=UPI0023001DE0|nr:SecY subunit of pre protein translocase [Mycotypha africana]KAI8973259.1 SecY subunit of pre protein translocase [Mycotypha africana]
MGLRVLHILKPFMGLLPEIESPIGKIPLNERLLYTAVALIGYLVMAQLPLWGVISKESSDPLYYFRVVLGAHRGTLMELGVLPILTSGMVMQLTAAARVIHVDYSLKEERALFCGAQKLIAVLIAIGQAALLVFTGFYGDPTELGPLRCGALVLQIVFASTITLLSDELLQKGYGIGSGINLFVATNVAQTFLWKSISFVSYETFRGSEKEGAIVALFSLLKNRSNKVRALKDAFYRTDLTNMMDLIATLVTFGLVIYVQGFRIELPVKSNRMRGQRASYPIRFFYTSSMPIMLLSAVYANIHLISQTLFMFFGNHFFIRFLGIWEPIKEETVNQLYSTGGLVYYLSAPHSLTEAISSPLRTALYIIFSTVACIYLSKAWVDISGSTSRDVARQLKDQQLAIAGFRDVSMHKELQRIIPPAAAFGGASLAIIASVADIFGCIGTGAGILMAVTIIFQYFEMFIREQMEGNASMETMMAGQ